MTSTGCNARLCGNVKSCILFKTHVVFHFTYNKLCSMKDGIQCRSTKDHSNADCLSRFPINLCSNVVGEELPDEIDFFYNSNLDLLPVTQESMANSTRKDSVLAGVLNSAQTGDRYDTPNLVPYFLRKNKISVHQGCLVWGLRVIVPSELRGKILHELYEGHQGLVKMKALARSCVRWPKIDRDAEQLAGACFECLQKRPDPSPVLHPWDWPEQPWKRVHAEFAAPFLNHMFLVVIDAHSKWLEVVQIASTTSTATIGALGSYFFTIWISRETRQWQRSATDFWQVWIFFLIK